MGERRMRKFEICKGFENENITLPTRATIGSAGYDLQACKTITIKKGEMNLIPTGVKAKMEKDEVLLVFPRSSLGKKKGLILTNSVAVIDADYYSNPNNDGHIMINLFNFSNTDQTIEKGERFAQGIFIKYLTTDDDQTTKTREGGFGSTGNK